MTSVVKLSKYGEFLSGRSLPSRIIREEKERLLSKPVYIDFADIPLVNQSFLSQLFFELSKMGFDQSDLIFQNVSDQGIQTRIDQQLVLIFSK
jgi:hypothetical protein